jgi:hypothetical protein
MSKQNPTGKPDLYQQLYQAYSEVHSDLNSHSPGSLVNLFAKVAAKSSTAQSSDAASSEESENVKKKGFVHVSKKFLLFYCSFSILAWPSSVVSNFRKWFEGHREI